MSLLKTSDGRYSRKSITWAGSTIALFLIIGWGSYSGNWPPSYVVEALVALIVLVLTGTIIDKKLANKNEK